MNREFMAEAIRLSWEKMEAGEGGPFGAVIVKDDEIIGKGWNRVISTNDPTAHAEIVAIRNACARLEDFSLEGCEIYVNCEPCPMCLAAIYWAGIRCVYFAATRKDAAKIGFADDFIYQEFALPMDKRKVALRQMMREEALPALQAWLAKEDRIEY